MSYPFASGMIQRLRISAGVTCCRPKSSITSVPQLLLSCMGALLTPDDWLVRTSKLSSVSSPPTAMVGRRIRTQRSSMPWKRPRASVGQRLNHVVVRVVHAA